MSDDYSKIIVPPEEKENSELQKVLQQVPDDILFQVIAERIQQEPKKRI